MNTTADTDKLKKASRRAALLALAAFLVVMAAIAHNVIRLNAIDTAIAEQEAVVTHRMQVIAGLEEEVERLTYAPELKPYAHAEELLEIRDVTGRQMYDFMLWIDPAAFRGGEIAEVTWRSNARELREVTSTDRTNGFSVTYRGTSCLPSVRVVLRYRGGSEETMDFNMCAALGW